MRKILSIILALVPAILLGILYYPTAAWLYERYTAPDSYYSHGFLVPFITAYLIWIKKDCLKDLGWRYNQWGLVLILAALLVHAFSTLAAVFFVSGYSLLLLAFGVTLYFFGKEITRQIVFPLSFLVFMLPLPLVAINAISFPLRMFVTKMSVGILNSITTMPVTSEGFRILFPGDSLVIGSPCSGLRSLISLLALGSVFAHLLKAGSSKKLLLFSLSVPVAIASNVIRIIILCVGTYYYGSRSVLGTFHDVTGYVMFVIAFVLMWYGWKNLETTHQRA
jgi:exosortase